MSSRTFLDLGVPADLVDLLSTGGITSPFPIQEATLPDALAGRDVSGRAPTGSGKTLAFGLAVVCNTERATPKKPTALVLVPTRELAAQVQRDLGPLAKARGRSVATVYGGTGYEAQRRALRGAVDVLVACPGRLEDLIQQGDVRLDDVGVVVVDEADRMADMGFLPSVRRLLDRTRPDRQTMLFSATLDGEVDVLVRKYQRDPVRHETGSTEQIAPDVRHHFWRAERNERVSLTARLVTRNAPAIVFCRTRHGADRLAKQLARSGVEAAAIHGSRSQPQRERALAAFAAGRVQVLVATDVAARGIHVDDVSCIVHYDPPSTHKDYVHRSGRTGRAGAGGIVVSLVGREQASDVRAIQKALQFPTRIDNPDGERLAAPVAVADRPVPVSSDRRPVAHRGGSGSHGGSGYGGSSSKPRRNRQRRKATPKR